MSRKINCLDQGYVILHDTMGTDLTVANAARVSFNKKTEQMRPQDEKLIKFLVDNGHMSPFRHATLQFEFYAPLMMVRQHWKYVVGSDHTMDAWNESSRRYVTDAMEFYIPRQNEWRSAPADKKQGSGNPLDEATGEHLTETLMGIVERACMFYEHAMELGVCAEQARLFLPAYALYLRYYWTASLQSVIHFLSQRLEHDAQKEIQVYAAAVRELAMEKFPYSIGALLK